MKVVCVQLSYPDGESKADRVERVLGLIDAAADTDLVVLPELWPTGYFAFDRYAVEAEPLNGTTIGLLREAAERHGIHLMGGSFIERHDRGLANCAVLIGPDGTVTHTYRKIHLFGYESAESRLLTPGDSIGAVITPLGPIGMTTCYDLRFPELYRLLVDSGAQLVIVPAAWPRARLEHWRLFLRARAVEDQVFMVGCNGAGPQEGTELAGHSMVVDPWGGILAEAGEAEESLRAEVDLGQVADTRSEFPVLDQRRFRAVQAIPGA